MVMSPQVSWLFFKARAKRPYLDPYGPSGLDADKVTAEFKDGVLKVHLPKSEITKPKQIEVKVT